MTNSANRYNVIVWPHLITVERPTVLVLIPAGIFLVWAFYRVYGASITDVTRRQSVVLRCVVIVLIVLSMAGTDLHRRSGKMTTLFVVDVSDSIPSEIRQADLEFIKSCLKSQGSEDKVGLVVFGREPFVEVPPGTNIDVAQVRAAVPGDATDIESALQAAAGAMPTDGDRRIVLMTDGRENLGSSLSDVGQLNSQGVQVDIAPMRLQQRSSPEALVDRIVAPAHVMSGAPFRIRTVISSNQTETARIVIMRDNSKILDELIHLNNGKTAIYSDDRVQTAGEYRYSAQLTPTLDTDAKNNTGAAVVLVQGAPRVLCLRDANEPLTSALPRALAAEGIEMTVMQPMNAPKTVAAFAAYDSIILSDVSAGDLSGEQETSLAAASSEFGVGLGMIGGLNSFGAGGFSGSPLEGVLPVTMTPPSSNKIPFADVVIVLDASGSMSAEENGVEKVQIAARAALNLLSALQNGDRVAVLAVTETPTLVMPLVSPSASSKYVPEIEAVSAGGGGIDCRNGLEAAYTLLQYSNAPIKHVIICPDTTDSEQQEGCVALATAVYRAEKISTSVCGIGQWSDSDVPFQRELASAGHGQLFVANQATDLPQFFQRDVTAVKQKLYLEGVFGVNFRRDQVANAAAAPAILGYNLVTAEPGATVPAKVGPHDDVLFAYWRHGTGKTFAFTSDDDNHWAQRWTKWSDFSAFWSHVVRWSMRSPDDQSFQTQVSNIRRTGHIVVDAYSPTGYDVFGRFSARVAAPDRTIKEVDLEQTAPGRYEGSFDTSAIGGYLVQVTDLKSAGHQMAAVATSYSPELANLVPDWTLLRQLSQDTHGTFLNSPAEAFRPGFIRRASAVNLTAPLLALASFVFLLDVAWRRLGWRITVQSAEVMAGSAAKAVNVAAHELKQRRPRAGSNALSEEVWSVTPVRNDPDILRKRTASRSELEDDDPFPFVASLPPRQREDKAVQLPKEKS